MIFIDLCLSHTCCWSQSRIILSIHNRDNNGQWTISQHCITSLHNIFTPSTPQTKNQISLRWHSSILWSILAITHCSHDPSWHQADKTSCHHQLWSLASLVTWHLTITTQLEKEWLVRTIETMTPDCGEVSAILESHWQSNIYNWVSGVECIKELLTTG